MDDESELQRLLNSFKDFALQRGWAKKDDFAGSLDIYLEKLEKDIEIFEAREADNCPCFTKEELDIRNVSSDHVNKKKDEANTRNKRRSVCQRRVLLSSSSSDEDDVIFKKSPDVDNLDSEADDTNVSEKRPEAASSSDDDYFDDFVNKVKKTKNKNNYDFLSSDEEDGLDNFIDDTPAKEATADSQWRRHVAVVLSSDEEDGINFDFKSVPARKPRSKKTENSTSKTPKHISTASCTPFRTPKNIDRNAACTPSILDRVTTPKTTAGSKSVAYKRQYKQLRDKTAQELFVLFNETVFNDKLPGDMNIQFNKRMTKTAGFCYYYNNPKTMIRTAKVEMAEKVCDSVERLRDTLIHELCHAAAWILNGVKCGHGTVWKYWACKAHKAHTDLPPISRCHQFDVQCKYNYRCMEPWCGRTYGRHSKSLKLCPSCQGPLQLLGTDGVTPLKERKANKFALFVKNEFSAAKSSNPGKSHADIMKLISNKFSSLKA